MSALATTSGNPSSSAGAGTTIVSDRAMTAGRALVSGRATVSTRMTASAAAIGAGINEKS
jgi:hypothetical protein